MENKSYHLKYNSQKQFIVNYIGYSIILEYKHSAFYSTRSVFYLVWGFFAAFFYSRRRPLTASNILLLRIRINDKDSLIMFIIILKFIGAIPNTVSKSQCWIVRMFRHLRKCLDESFLVRTRSR